MSLTSNIKKHFGYPALVMAMLLAGHGGSSASSRGIKPQKSIRVLYFFSPVCPVCKYYTATVNAIARRYKDSVDAQLIFCGDYRKEKLRAYVQLYQISIPWKKDPHLQLAHRYGARITPQVVVVFKDKIAYSGLIDDAYMDIAHPRPQTLKHYLGEAIEALLRGKKILVAQTTAVGCLINPEK